MDATRARKRLTAGISNLDTRLADMEGDDFTHCGWFLGVTVLILSKAGRVPKQRHRTRSNMGRQPRDRLLPGSSSGPLGQKRARGHLIIQCNSSGSMPFQPLTTAGVSVSHGSCVTHV